MSNVDGSQHEREVLMTERQKHLDFDQQQQHNQGTKQSDRDREFLRNFFYFVLCLHSYTEIFAHRNIRTQI